MPAEKFSSVTRLELYPDLVFRCIGWYFLGIFLTDTEGKLGKDLWYRTFGGNPFFPRFCPLFDGPSPPLEGSSRKISQKELPPNLTVQKIPYIPYRIYQPATSAGNLPIPAKLPVNRWDTTLIFSIFHKNKPIGASPGCNYVLTRMVIQII